MIFAQIHAIDQGFRLVFWEQDHRGFQTIYDLIEATNSESRPNYARKCINQSLRDWEFASLSERRSIWRIDPEIGVGPMVKVKSKHG